MTGIMDNKRLLMLWLGLCLMVPICFSFSVSASEPGESFPRYKPASRAPVAIDIRSNRYGASRSAPDALEIGDIAEDFSAPRVGGGIVSLGQLRSQGDVVLIFYRGHW